MTEILDGKMVVYNEDDSYEIEHITAEFEEDIHDVIGVVRCTGITIENDVPSQIKSEAEDELYNAFADIEYNDANGDGQYMKKARKAISKRTGVDTSRIVIE